MSFSSIIQHKVVPSIMNPYSSSQTTSFTSWECYKIETDTQRSI